MNLADPLGTREDQMLIRQFMSWAEKAPAGERAEATSALVRAFLYADLDRIEQGEMERAIMSLLDDPSPLVRRALAEAVAGSADAPHHLVAALAADQDDIAALVLARSPILLDAELIDAAAVGGPFAQCAIAARPSLSAAVAGALAEVGCREAVLALCGNGSSVLADISIHRVLERCGQDGAIRDALGRREDLGPDMRHALVLATAEALRRFVTSCRWIAPERASRVVDEASDRATVMLAQDSDAQSGDRGRLRFAAYLRHAGRLTPALVLRTLLSGQTGLFEAALSELSGMPLGRVAGLVRQSEGLGFSALYKTAGLPSALLPAFRAALSGCLARSGAHPACGLDRPLVERVLKACAAHRERPVEGLTALLRRFQVEAVREEARTFGVPVPDRAMIDRSDLFRRIEPGFRTIPALRGAA